MLPLYTVNSLLWYSFGMGWNKKNPNGYQQAFVDRKGRVTERHKWLGWRAKTKKNSGPVKVYTQAEIDAMETMMYEERYGGKPK